MDDRGEAMRACIRIVWLDIRRHTTQLTARLI